MPRWTQETVYVARNEQGRIIGARDESPEEMEQIIERLRQSAITPPRRQIKATVRHVRYKPHKIDYEGEDSNG